MVVEKHFRDGVLYCQTRNILVQWTLHAEDMMRAQRRGTNTLCRSVCFCEEEWEEERDEAESGEDEVEDG